MICYKKARAQHDAAYKNYCAARAAKDAAYNAIPRADLDTIIAESKNPKAAAARAEAYEKAQAAYNAAYIEAERAELINKAADAIESAVILNAAAAAAPAILAKYAGKKAGPKTREKAAAEIAAKIGVAGVHVIINQSEIKIYTNRNSYNSEYTTLYTIYPGMFIDSGNTFTGCTEMQKPSADFPEDLEKWAADFLTAREEIKEACKAFEEKTRQAESAFTIGGARFPHYYINKSY